MNKRSVTVVLCVMVLTTSAIALNGPARSALISIGLGEGGSNQNSNERQQKSARGDAPLHAAASPGQPGVSAPAQVPDIPPHVVYGLLFRERELFKKKAREQEQKGADGTHFREFHQKKLNLGADHSAALDRIADEANREVTKLDKKARQIIEEARARHPGGVIKEGELPPPPPAELNELESQRTDVLMRARGRLRAALGDAEFERLDALLAEDAAKKMKVVGSPSASAAGQPGAEANPPGGGKDKQ